MEDAWQSLKRVVKVSIAEMISGVMDIAKIMPSALGPLGLMFSGTSLDKRKPPSFLQGKFQPWIPPTASHDAGMGMIPGVTMAELEQSEKDLAKARREEAQAAREAAAAAKELENSIQSWVRSSRAMNPITPANLAWMTPGFSVAGPQAGNPWASLFGGTGGGTNTWFQTGFGGPQVTPGWSGPLPGQPLTTGQIIGAKPPGAWGQLGGSLFGALPSVLLSAFTGGGNIGSADRGRFLS